MRLDTQQPSFLSPVVSKPERRRFAAAFLAAAVFILTASATEEAELSPDTLRAWDANVQSQNARVAEYSKTTPFLWSDQSLDRLRRLHKGEMIVSPFGENPYRVQNGLIHHWLGAVFLPGARLCDVLSVVRDYGKYKDIFAPNVVESRVVRETVTEGTVSLRLLNKAVLANFAVDTEFQSTFKRIDKNKSYSVSYTTRVREIENYGSAYEREAPANTGRGLIWRLYSISRFKQQDGGVYLELEAVALSRDVPGPLRWLVDPIVRRTSRSSIQVSLEKTRAAVLETRLSARRNENYGVRAQPPFSKNLPTAQVQNGFTP